MLCTSLVRSAVQLRNGRKLWRRHVAPQMFVISKNDKSTWWGKAREEETEDNDQPITYSTSDAAKWRAADIRADDRLWYDGAVLAGCMFVSVLYFMFVREENDLDDALDQLLLYRLSSAREQVYGKDDSEAASVLKKGR